MITRGHYIGEIIDELSTVAQQVAMRNRLGLTDLTVLLVLLVLLPPLPQSSLR